MEQRPASLMKSTLTSGIYIGVVLILVSVVFYVAGLMFETWAQYVSWPILIGGTIYAQLSYRKSLGGEMTYGQALGAGILALVFATVLSAIFDYLLRNVIDPSLKEQLRIMMEQKLIEQGQIPEEQLDSVLNIIMKLLPIIAILQVAFTGLIISLITGIFTQKKPSDIVPE